jgi:hypothetical protein
MHEGKGIALERRCRKNVQNNEFETSCHGAYQMCLRVNVLETDGLLCV